VKGCFWGLLTTLEVIRIDGKMDGICFDGTA
jgi:hypothetical protein